jgi:hypothetical protein
LKYGLDPENPHVQEIAASINAAEAQKLLHRDDVGSGLLIKYPSNGSFTIRLDNPIFIGDKQAKYLRRKGEPNTIFNPGLDLDKAQEIFIVEGELKSLAGFLKGFPVIGLTGIWGWRTETEDVELLAEGDRLSDTESLIPELKRDWAGKRVTLIYDSDIAPGHKAYDAFPRLAEQFYRLGAAEIRIVTLPSILSEGKTGLDDLLKEKGDEGPEFFKKTVERVKPYIPTRGGAVGFVDRLLDSGNWNLYSDDLVLAAAILMEIKGEFSARQKLESIRRSKIEIDTIIREAKKRSNELLARPKPVKEKKVDIKLHKDIETARLRITDDRYTVNKNGCLCVLKTKETSKGLVTVKVPLCNFTAWPVREIVKDDGASTERFIELEGMKPDYTFPKVSVPMTAFGEMEWVPELWGARANIIPGSDDSVRYVIQTMVDDSQPDSVIYTHLGWRKIGDLWAYLHVGGAVGAKNIEVEINPRLAGYALPQDEDVNAVEALTTSLKLLTVGKPEITYPLLALIYLAPLCDPLKRAGREPGFASFLAGTTGSFKSTITALFLSHFGRFDGKGLPASFRDTAYFTEIASFIAKDTILAIDDLYPPQNPREKIRLEGVLEYLTRSQGDRTGRGRLRSDITLRMGNPPRGLALCTGEEMNLGPGSSYYRLLLLKVEKGDIDLDLLTEAQAKTDTLRYAMKKYLEFLAPQMEEAPERLRENFDTFRATAAGLSTIDDKHRRLDEVVAHLTIGFASLAEFAVAFGVWTEADAKRETEEAIAIFVEITDSQAVATSENDPVNRFFNGLRELLATDKIYLAGMNDERSDEVLPTALKVGWGPDDKGMVYLSLSAALKEVKALYKGTDEPLMTPQNTLLDMMEQREIIQKGTEDKPRRIIVKWIGKKAQRVLPVPQTFIYGGDESD